MYDNIKGFQIIFLNNTINTSLKQKDKKKKPKKTKKDKLREGNCQISHSS